MSATLVARGLAAGHATRTLFSGLDLVVAPGDVVGLVGANGAGKSTLLRLLAGVDAPVEGEVGRTPPDAAVGWLPQEVERHPGEDVAAHLGRRTGVAAAERELDAATAALSADAGEVAGERYAAALEHWLALGGADLAERSGAVLADLGVALPVEQQMTTLSGGQAARVGLAALLLSRFDVLLLDEPTNDLDLDGLERLERFVSSQRAGVVLVSHDREFLARCSPASSSSTSPSSRSRSTAAGTRRTWRSATSPAATPGRRTSSTPTGATSSPSGPARSGAGSTRGCGRRP